MKHYGDITKINGAEVPIVDIVTGGSPCQDLSVAGKRAGLDGERSGLFMEQVRVFKELRNECIRQLRVRGAAYDVRSIRPRFFVWENVPGALSSPGKDRRGEDFRCVLEEICRIADKDATVPRPKNGMWSTSGCIMGDGYSVAWRVHDAQFWGVPQRRKRIALVADFAGESAPEILFERKSMSRDIEPGREKGEGITPTSETDLDETISFQERAGCDGGGAKEYSYNTTEQEHCQHSIINQSWDGSQTSPTLTANNAGGAQRMPDKDNFNAVITECIGNGQLHDAMSPDKEVSKTLNCMVDPMKIVTYGVDCYNQTQTQEVSKALNSAATDSDHIPCVYGLDRASFNQGKNAKYDFSIEEEKAQTIVAKGPGGVMTNV